MRAQQLISWLEDHPSCSQLYELVQCGVIKTYILWNWRRGLQGLVVLDDGIYILTIPTKSYYGAVNRQPWQIEETDRVTVMRRLEGDIESCRDYLHKERRYDSNRWVCYAKNALRASFGRRTLFRKLLDANR